MTTATPDRIQPATIRIEAAKAELLKRFEDRLARASEAVVLKAVALADEKAFAVLAKIEADKKRSIATRNQEAVARMRARSFERLVSRCELLDSKEAYEIMGITKQALSQKTQAGKLLAYTNTSNRRKYYPSFQFSENKPRAVIAKLIKELNVDPADTEAMNFLVQHLVSKMDYADPGKPSNEVLRLELLDDENALEVIKRDYTNAFDMGQ